MNANWDRCLRHVLKDEGGYVNHPRDPGGRTNLGVTQRVWEVYIGHKVTEEEMRALTVEKVKPLYKRNYWDACNGDFLPLGVDLVVFDYAVNSGVARSLKTLQKVVGTEADGRAGPDTMRALQDYINRQGPRGLIDALCESRMKFLRALGTWNDFGKGWTRRVARVRVSSVSWLGED